MATVACSLLA